MLTLLLANVDLDGATKHDMFFRLLSYESGAILWQL